VHMNRRRLKAATCMPRATHLGLLPLGQLLSHELALLLHSVWLPGPLSWALSALLGVLPTSP